MTKAQVAQAVATLVCGYPSAKWTEENASVYETMLGDLDFEPMMAAVARLVRTSKFLPSVAEVRAAVLEITEGVPRIAEDAWGDVLQAMHRFGPYRKRPTFEDPLVEFAVERMGWRALLEGRNDAADRARFCELYSQARDRERRDKLASPRLAGSSAPALPAPVAKLVSGIGGKL